MTGYYEITEAFYNELLSYEDVNTVVIADIDKVDTDKQTMFPLVHLLIGSVQFPTDAINRFNVTVTVMDLVDQTKINIQDLTEQWKGIDNRQDVLNYTLAVLEKLTKSVRTGNLSDLNYDLIGEPTAEPFEDRFQNLLTGWSMTYTIDIINTNKDC